MAVRNVATIEDNFDRVELQVDLLHPSGAAAIIDLYI